MATVHIGRQRRLSKLLARSPRRYRLATSHHDLGGTRRNDLLCARRDEPFGTRRISARESGAVLVTVLSILLALMVVGVTSARMALDDERSARLERDRQLAFHAADAAQRDGLVQLGEQVCLPSSPSDPPVWLSRDLGASAYCMQYGVLSDAVMATGSGALPAQLPGFVIESMPSPLGAVTGDYYRITSVGYGTRASTYVVLQSIVRVGNDGYRTRLSWREVGNWREQHDALK